MDSDLGFRCRAVVIIFVSLALFYGGTVNAYF